ncbi:hypothetical protein niasHT_013530 [Heterodera trifolii]|uniref:Uncharacterized protein n=1 Tax=Heterodera trifolii TaxID=157864 RepID=A0ABD2LEE0_9BILA
MLFPSFLLLFLPTVFAPGPSRENKLFIECAVRAPKGRHGPETVVSHAKMENNRMILFGLGGNLYTGDSELSELCKEDKEFAATSRMTPQIREGAPVEQCENGKLTVNGKNLILTSKKQMDYEQCFAGNYELFECPEDACDGKSALLLVNKKHEPKAKSYSFVYGGKMLVNEVTVAEVSADQLECVRRECAEESVPVVEEAIRWRRRAKDERKELAQGTDKFKVFKECAVKRRRIGKDGKAMGGKARIETLVAHVKMDKLVLFFGMGGNLYAGESILSGECEEDKLFTRSKVTAMRSTLLGCHKASTESGDRAKLTLRKAWQRKSTETNGRHTDSDRIQMEIRTNRALSGSQCHAQLQTNHNKNGEHQQEQQQYDIYKCPREECGGRDRLLLIRKKSNSNGKLISRGVLMADTVLFADMTAKQWQCVRQICGSNVRIPVVEAVKRRTDKSGKRRGKQRGQRRRSTAKRMARKGKGDREETKAKRAQSNGEGEQRKGSDQHEQREQPTDQ